MNQERLKKEEERLKERYAYEEELTGGCTYVFGIDEAGRGPLCGPVCAGCCLLDKSSPVLWLNDSKKLSEKRREEVYTELTDGASVCSTSMVSAKRIDEINILQATFEAMRSAFENCLETSLQKGVIRRESVERGDLLILTDGNRSIPGLMYPQKTVIGGDRLCPSISAASILAKVTRDRLMQEYALLYPEYGFEKNKGYGTAEHMEAIRTHGILPIHRRTFLKGFQ